MCGGIKKRVREEQYREYVRVEQNHACYAWDVRRRKYVRVEQNSTSGVQNAKTNAQRIEARSI